MFTGCFAWNISLRKRNNYGRNNGTQQPELVLEEPHVPSTSNLQDRPISVEYDEIDISKFKA
jgi:hypothetical protein